jgi:hypothetical protein
MPLPQATPQPSAAQGAFDKGFRCALTCAKTFHQANRSAQEIVDELERLANQYPPPEPVTMPHPTLAGYHCAIADYLQATQGQGDTYALYKRKSNLRTQVGHWGLNSEGVSYAELTSDE